MKWSILYPWFPVIKEKSEREVTKKVLFLANRVISWREGYGLCFRVLTALDA